MSETGKIIDPNKELKEKFLDYFKQLPVQKLAGAKIGKHEDTIVRWKNDDADFAEQIEMAKAEWALKNVKSVRSKEWLLERLMRTEFAPPQQRTDVTSGGRPLPIFGGGAVKELITKDVHTNNSDKEDI